ncbi:MAG: hypothetical protein ACFFH0_04385 [Promethearchaeota archaeon]
MSKLSILEFVPQTSIEAANARNWIFVLDFSGSMGWTLHPLCENVMDEIRKVPQGDRVTVAWFSGIGYNGFIVKGCEITGEKSYTFIEKAIEVNLYTRNTTCFSEILAELRQVVTDLTPFSDTFNLLFFTDGCPVVPDTRKEVAAVEQAIKAVAPKLAAVLFIGYGNYYNRPLLLDMTKWAGGAFVHSRNLDATQDQIVSFMEHGIISSGRVEVTVGDDAELAFAVSGDQIVTLDIDADFVVSVPSGSVVWTISRQPAVGAPVVNDARYAAAAALTRVGRLGDAMEILGELGDKHLIDRLNAAYTLDDIGEAEAEIVAAVTDESKRFVGGYAANYVPDPAAFCLLDAIDALVGDHSAKFYPQDKRWDYKRIGPKMEKESKYPKFRPDNDGCFFNTLVWNKEMLNLSVQARTNGSIILPEKGAAKRRLPGVFSTYKWNNYTLVKDGAVNVEILPASFSHETFDLLKDNGMIDEDHYADDYVYAVDLTAVPVMNRAIAEGYRSGRAVAESVIRTHTLKARLKVLRWYLSELVGEKAPEVAGYTVEQAAFLLSKGIDKNGAYSPPVEKIEPVDFYMAKTFEVKVVGLSSLPKVEDVLKRRKDKKGQTTAGALMLKAVEYYESHSLADGERQPWLEETIADTWADLRAAYADIARAKFAVLLGKSWFEDVERDNPTIDVGGYEVTFDVGEREIKF